MDSNQWNSQLTSLPSAHILQTWEWGTVKQSTGWKVFPQTWQGENGLISAAGLVLQRAINTGGFSARLNILYIPRGPLLNWSDEVLRSRILDDIQSLARRYRAIFIKIDPEVVVGSGIHGSPDAVENTTGHQLIAELQQRGWRYSNDQIQFPNTVLLDLTPPEEEWLARMKPKTRYNLRLAQKKGVTIRQGTIADLPLLYRMYAETSVRDGFVIRPESYYLNVWQTFMEKKMSHPLIAEVGGEVVAGLFLFYFASSAWYLYGMSRSTHREKMPNYLLQWEAMRQARALGCTRYDLWGAPTHFDESDSMWGVFRFKEGLGGTVIRTIGAWDYTSQPLLYALYTSILPKLLDNMRRHGKSRVQRIVSAST